MENLQDANQLCGKVIEVPDTEGVKTMRLLRTPDSRFDGLPEFPYEPRYVNIDGVRSTMWRKGAAKLSYVCTASLRGVSYTESSFAPLRQTTE